MMLALWLGIGAKYIENRSIDLESATRDLENVTHLFEENVLRSIGEMDKALLYLRRSIETNKANRDFHKIVGTADILSALIVQVAIIDSNGIMRASNVGPQPAPSIDLSDRPHFRFHVGKMADQLFISQPMVGRVSKKWSVQLTRRFLDADGSFGGVVVASFDPSHFENFYGRIDLGEGAAYALIGTDGVVRAAGGKSDDRLQLGQSVSSLRISSMLTGESSAVFWDAAPVSRAPQLVAIRNVAGETPLAVSASIPEKTVYAESTRSAIIMLVVGTLFSILIVLVTRIVWRTEVQVKNKARELQLTLDHMTQGIIMVTKDLDVPILNHSSIKLLDLPETFLENPPRFDELIGFLEDRGEYANASFAENQKAFDVYGPRDGVLHFPMYERTRPNGTVVEVRTSRLDDGGFVRTFSDVTERRNAQSLADRMASEDSLTGLANRRTLAVTLDRIVNEHAQGGSAARFAVLYLDLDRFKLVNDTQGHAVGDKLLQAVAQRLKSSLRSTDFIARLGGDEFAIILALSENGSTPETIAQRLVDSLGGSFDVEGHHVLIGVSIGIAIGGKDGRNSNELLIAADLALYAAKAAGRNTFRSFSKEMNEGVKARQQIEIALREAIGSGGLELHYQPIINLQKNAITGFEALVRWPHPTKGMIPPDQFIPVAEESELIQVLGQWVLQEACRQATKWSQELTVAVNISPQQFANPGLARMIEQILAESGLAPDRLEIEITEGLLMRNNETNLNTLRKLKDLGVRVAMDDFGTGYSSLAYLQSFPFDRIKVDRSFVSRLGSNESSSVIVKAVVDIAGSRGMRTTAEGVETELQRNELQSLGCDEAQGYLFSRPVPVSDIPQIIAEWATRLREAA